MHVPDWRTLALNDGVLPEPTPEPDRIVVWIRGKRVNGFQEWERISTAARPAITAEQGACAVPATSILARQRMRGFFGRLLQRFGRASSAEPSWLLPNGASARQCGERRTDLLLVWADQDGTPLDESAIETRWGGATLLRQLGKNLFVIYGIEGSESPADTAPPLPNRTPFAMAERALQEARKQGDRRKFVAALTDLGILHSNEGKCQRAIELLEEALRVVRQTRDRVQEADVVGNLGMSLIGKDPQRSHELLLQELTIAREIGSRFAEKTALNHLGIFYLRARDTADALAHLDEAVRIARDLDDRQHEADLCWLLSIVYAEDGRRDSALAHAQAALEMLETMGKPQAAVLADHLRRYRGGNAELGLSRMSDTGPDDVAGSDGVETIVGGWIAQQSQNTQTDGPSWLRMGFTAAKALTRYIGSGMQRVPAETYEKRQRTCMSCEYHTGLRCKLCGCFTSVKTRLPHEECPIGKWPSATSHPRPAA